MQSSGRTTIETAAMRRAIALSALGVGTTSPNPPVGCVILDSSGGLVGEGYHRRKGEPHAEANALAGAGDRAADGTALVTLEPCNHHGRTPPCHQALIDAGVRRVVIAVLDPTSRGEGGAARLRAAGLDVEIGLLADEALLVLGSWLAALDDARPRVTWVYRLTADGARAVPDDVAQEWGLRYGFDAIVNDAGAVEEGIVGGHGPEVFSLRAGDGTGADDLASLYAGGTRSLLVTGASRLAEELLAQGRVDHVHVYLDPAITTTGLSWQVLPPGFRITRLRRLSSGVVIEGSMGRPDRSEEGAGT